MSVFRPKVAIRILLGNKVLCISFGAGRVTVVKSLSDLSGTDVYIHHGCPSGVFTELTSAFVRSQRQPSVDQMKLIYNGLREGAQANAKCRYQVNVQGTGVR